MSRATVAILLALSLPHPARADAREVVDASLLVAAEAALAVDMLQTLDIKNHPWRSWYYQGTVLLQETRESNPLLGPHPSDAKVIAYFAGCGTATYLAWRWLPRPWRTLLPVALLAVEVPLLASNARNGMVAFRF